MALGYRYVETDVHVTADGVLCAFHDERLDRVTDRTGLIRDQTWAEVSQARVDGLEPIPLLEDLLTTWPEIRINIDPKHDSAVEALAATLRRADAVERVCIGSFSDARIARLRELLGPALCTSFGPKGDRPTAGRQLRRADRRARRLPCLQVPPAHKGVPIVDERFAAHGPRSAAAGARLDHRRRRPRCTGCSTSASTAS